MNNPDKIIFVGEALVGNEAVDQLTKFDRALRDFSASSGGKERGIDGMLVTKWDTVDDKVRVPRDRSRSRARPWRVGAHRADADVSVFCVLCLQVGAALSMTYVTGQPIIFVGCGQVCPHLVSVPLLGEIRLRLLSQTYTDLRQLRVANVVQAILSD